MKFKELELHSSLQTSIDALQFDECTPIQEAAITPIIDGRDLAGLAQTGTGKTAAYLIPLMERLLRSKQEPNADETEKQKVRRIRDFRSSNFVLILVPTRELAEQVRDNVTKLGKDSGITSAAIYGGMSYEPQKSAINRGVDFLIATPGRLIDLQKEHVVDLNQVRAVVFDEADRMFDMGFKDDMKYLLKRIPSDRQFLVFSATLNFDVLNVAYEFGSDPVEIDVSRDQAKAENVTDELFHVGESEKPAYLLSLLRKHKPNQAIIFSNFKSQVERIAKFLTANEIPAMGISSLMTQAQRQRVMEQFKIQGNDRNILVATDVAARGLDIKGVDIVINFELPGDPENYVHRIGRTGRAGEMGKAFSLSGDRDVDALARIEDYIGHKVVIGWLDDQDLLKEFKPMPSERFEKKKSFGSGKPRFDKDSRRKPKPWQGKEGDSNRGPRRDRTEKANGADNSSTPRQQQQSPRPQSATGGSSSSDSQQHPQRHRDRASGRHRDQSRDNSRDTQRDSSRDNNKPHSQNAQGGRKNAYQQKPQSERFNPDHRRPFKHKVGSKPKEKSKTNAGVGNKVASFIKRLFS